MSTIEEEILARVKQWVNYADEDLMLAKHALNLSSGVPYRLIAYHSQQCAEKYLKAFLVFRRVDFPYTHNISRLLEICGQMTVWQESLRDAEALSYYAVTTSYPGESEEVTMDEAEQAIELAEKVRETVRQSLVAEGVKIVEDPSL